MMSGTVHVYELAELILICNCNFDFMCLAVQLQCLTYSSR